MTEFKRLHPLKADGTADTTVDLIPDVTEDNIYDSTLSYKIPMQPRLDAGTGITLTPDNGTHHEVISINTTAMFNAIKESIRNAIYPVGSIYVSVNPDVNPGTTIGGTWTRIRDAVLYAPSESSTEVLGTAYGSGELPVISHSHTLAVNSTQVYSGNTTLYTSETVWEDAAKALMKASTTSQEWTAIVRNTHGTDSKTAVAKTISGNLQSFSIYNSSVRAVTPTVNNDLLKETTNGYLTGELAVYQPYHEANKNIIYIDSTHQHKIDLSKVTVAETGTNEKDPMKYIKHIAVAIWKRTA